MSFQNIAKFLAYLQMLPVLESGEDTLVGGQAVIEGVMMRAPHSYCVAVRKPDGEIATEETPLHRPSEKYRIFKYFGFRGIGALGQAMWLGVTALRFSARVSLPEDDPDAPSKEVSSGMMTLSLVFSFAFFVFLYKLVPLYLTTLLQRWFPVIEGRILFNLTDGLIRIAIFLVFLYGISRWKDIQRVFEYHGAEHRVVFNFESGKSVNVETAQTFSTFHPRCGTSFLIVVMVIAIGVYALIPFDGFLMKFVSRVVLLPVIMGLSYELIRFSAKHTTGLMAVISRPGLWLQRITTRPPAADQTEVAVRALEGAMELEESQGGELVIA